MSFFLIVCKLRGSGPRYHRITTNQRHSKPKKSTNSEYIRIKSKRILFIIIYSCYVGTTSIMYCCTDYTRLGSWIVRRVHSSSMSDIIVKLSAGINIQSMTSMTPSARQWHVQTQLIFNRLWSQTDPVRCFDNGLYLRADVVSDRVCDDLRGKSVKEDRIIPTTPSPSLRPTIFTALSPRCARSFDRAADRKLQAIYSTRFK